MLMFVSGFEFDQTRLAQADVAAPGVIGTAENNMVEHRNTNDFAGGDQLARQADILG